MSATVMPLQRALTASSTDTSFAAVIPTTTKPSGAGVFDLLDIATSLSVGNNVPRFIQLVPFGTDANNETFDMILRGWSRTTGAAGTAIWVPQILLNLSVTLGNIDAAAIGANHFLADTIVVNKGDSDGVISPANDTAASIITHLRGCELFAFYFDLTGAAAANCYWRVMDQG